MFKGLIAPLLERIFGIPAGAQRIDSDIVAQIESSAGPAVALALAACELSCC